MSRYRDRAWISSPGPSQTRLSADEKSAAYQRDDARLTTSVKTRVLGAVVGLVGDQAFRCFAYGDEPLRDRAVMRFAAGQEDGEKTAPSICECMDLCVAPASRAANCLLLLPPFPPAAERCTLTCVESIICVFAELPVPASFRNRFSQIPRRAQRTKRL